MTGLEEFTELLGLDFLARPFRSPLTSAFASYSQFTNRLNYPTHRFNYPPTPV